MNESINNQQSLELGGRHWSVDLPGPEEHEITALNALYTHTHTHNRHGRQPETRLNTSGFPARKNIS